jgi:hypothetical protein
MRQLLSLGFAIAVVVYAGGLMAEELKSGLQEGESIGAFTVEKCAGNAEDGVPEGEKLCYRCMLKDRPVVAVFARKADSKLAGLVKQLDTVVAKNADQKMASFVNLLGGDVDELKSSAKSLVEKSQAKHVAVVVPTDHENGPENLKLNPDADVTVLIYREGIVKANHALTAGSLDKKAIAAIVADTSKILK